ncbi:esterase/lipase family protein [Desulfobulbus elongatus]|uniref:esterase/lipase family protein n=1 Tax=Desulfobulbus elongatus TaxID=53332 RepID=UPI00048177DB|nr:alpha/beta fold hydrolase [Desulfobulbus elongatus]
MTTAGEGVILLHGLARTRRSMRPLAVFLARRGYRVVNVGYPSRRDPIEILARPALAPAVAVLRRQGIGTIHFVTHSMGGILLRVFLADEPLPELGRTVMLSPPNQGSELVDRLGRFAWFRLVFGPAGCQLGTGPDALPARLGPATFPVGILTGNRPALGLARFFPGPSDGKVAVARAQLAGMADFLVLPYGHALIMRYKAVQEQVAFFLENGRFKPVA